jgi:tRNA(fMet)-specific endonuclease VapC
MRRYLLDTNHVSAALDRVSRLRDRIQQLRKTGVIFGTCVPILCELEVGIQQTAVPQVYYRFLDQLLHSDRVWPIDPELAPLFGEIFLDLQRRGRQLSFVDIVLAALARLKNLTLLTTDRDFEALPDLRTENWLADTNGATG